jgi:hypothetical protein
VKYAGALAALAICSACGGGSAVAPSSAAPSSAALNGTYVGRTLFVNGRPVTAARLGGSVLPRYATLVPDLVQGRRREFIINLYTTFAAEFNYPKGDTQVGTINNVGGQGCTNVLYGYGKETFWILAGSDQITEYDVRKNTPLKTLSDSIGQPSSCAMDTSGDLAVGILDGSGGGDVIIFQNATGTGTVYTTPLFAEYFCGYDNQGNLFADGFGNAGFTLVELPKGSSTFKTITTSNTVSFPGSVQWDGTYLTVTDQSDPSLMYHYTVSGTTATLQSTVSLTGSSDCAQTWIATGVVYCGDAGNGDGEVFNYPAGGSPIAVLGSAFPTPLGTVAVEKKRSR